MALSSPRNIFGVHSAAPYSRATATYGVPYGIMKVLGGSSLSLKGDLIKLNGGSSPYPWAIERGQITAEMSLKIKEYPNFLFTLFLGKAPTSNAAEAAGSVVALANVVGTSMISTVGLATVLVIPTTGAADLKFGKYLVVAASATTVDVYALSDVDFARGANVAAYTSDAMKIAAAQTIVSTTATNITSAGVKLTGGSGTIGMTVGDAATFSTRPINTLSMDVVVGASGDTNPEFGCLVMAQKRSNGEMFEIDLHRCLGSGMPLGFEEFKWSEADIKVEAFYDSTLNKIFTVRQVSPSSVV